MRKVCVVIGSRANYGSIKSVMRAVQAHPDLHLQIIVGASALLDRFGSVVDVIERDGFVPDARVNMIVEGETPVTMAKSTGLGLLELPTLFELLKPDVVVTVGDRFETMATAVASAYMNIPLAHTMGGEVTGTIDESIRHAITKLAHSTFRRTGTRPTGSSGSARIRTPCTSSDVRESIWSRKWSATAASSLDAEWLDREGVGGHIATDEPFLLVSQHPVTTEYGQAERQIAETLMALHDLKMPTVMLWPNVDAGSEDISRGMRKFREKHAPTYIRFYKNFPVETYPPADAERRLPRGQFERARFARARSSGTPAVNIGTRQEGRERGPNVIDVGHDRAAIAEAIRRQVEARARIVPAHLYGDGKAGERIADVLSRAALHVQKRIQVPERSRCDPGARRLEGHSAQEPRAARGSSAHRVHGRRRACEPLAVARDRQHRRRGDRRGRPRGLAPTCRSCGRPTWRSTIRRCSTSSSDSLATLAAAERYRPDVLVLLQPTSPFRRADHIDAAVDLLISSGADSVVTVIAGAASVHPVVADAASWRSSRSVDGRPGAAAPSGQAAPLRPQRSCRRRNATEGRSDGAQRCTGPIHAAS